MHPAIIFFAVRDIGESPLGGGVAALLFGSALGLIDIFSYVTNGAMMLFLGALVLWLSGARTPRAASDVAARRSPPRHSRPRTPS